MQFSVGYVRSPLSLIGHRSFAFREFLVCPLCVSVIDREGANFRYGTGSIRDVWSHAISSPFDVSVGFHTLRFCELNRQYHSPFRSESLTSTMYQFLFTTLAVLPFFDFVNAARPSSYFAILTLIAYDCLDSSRSLWDIRLRLFFISRCPPTIVVVFAIPAAVIHFDLKAFRSSPRARREL